MINIEEYRIKRIAKEAKRKLKAKKEIAGSNDHPFDGKYKKVKGCWVWQGYKSKSGYGKTSYKGNSWLTHRLSYSLFVGELKPELYVCHKCDNPSCINPDHLFLGTAKENMEDCYNKGRHTNIFTKGHTPKNSKIDKNTACKILLFTMDNPDVMIKDVAKKFKVPIHTIKDIKRGRSYASVVESYDMAI